jgi:hypothetical protein
VPLPLPHRQSEITFCSKTRKNEAARTTLWESNEKEKHKNLLDSCACGISSPFKNKIESEQTRKGTKYIKAAAAAAANFSSNPLATGAEEENFLSHCVLPLRTMSNSQGKYGIESFFALI